MKTRLGWVAKYPMRKVAQYPLLQPETPIASLGAWSNFKLDQGLPLTFMVGQNGVNLVNGEICLLGKWYPSPPGSRPTKLIYFRRNQVSINNGEGAKCVHHVGYECFDHKLEICVPDNGERPWVLINDMPVANSIV